MSRLSALNRLRWYWRLPIKWAVLGLTLLAVCFPYPARLVRHLQHWRDPNALIEPDAPAIQPFIDELRPSVTNDLSPREALNRVERYVYKKIPYEWDWNTWGTADYLPTVTEAIEMGREDCDGRAVVAASLLRSFGFNAQLVTDFSHMWVKTDRGETMSPGKRKAVVATKHGLRVQLNAWREVPRALALGIAVFPLQRELIVLGVMWLLMLRPRGGGGSAIAGLACLLGGLLLLRKGGANARDPIMWMQWLGLIGFITGCSLMLVWAKYNARRAAGDRTSETPATGDDM